MARQTSTSRPRPHNPYAQATNYSKTNNSGTSGTSQRTITPQTTSRSGKRGTQRRGSSRSPPVPQRRRTATSPSATQQYPHRTGRYRSSRQFGATSLRVSTTVDNQIGGMADDSDDDDDNDNNEYGKDQNSQSNRPSKRAKTPFVFEDSDSDDDDALFDSPRLGKK